MPSIQIADKPTLDKLNSHIQNSAYGLSALRQALKDSTPEETGGYSFTMLPIEQRLKFVSNYQKNGFLEESVFIDIINSGQITIIPTGAIVKLSNSVGNNEYWVVADKNHDNTLNTIDLVPIGFVAEGMSFSDSPETTYGESSIRTWLNGEFLAGFSEEIQEKMINMNVITYIEGNVLTGDYSDKVKLLSAVEAGIYNSYVNSIEGSFVRDEGSVYPIMQYPTYRCNISISDGDMKSYWLRTCGNTTTEQLGVSVGGDYKVFTDKTDTETAGVFPCIRIRGTDNTEFVEIANNAVSMARKTYQLISSLTDNAIEQANIAANASTSDEALAATLIAEQIAIDTRTEYEPLDPYIEEVEEVIEESYELGNLIAGAYDTAKEAVESTANNAKLATSDALAVQNATSVEEARPYMASAEEQSSIAKKTVTTEENTGNIVSEAIEEYRNKNSDKITDDLVVLVNNAVSVAKSAYELSITSASIATDKAEEASNASTSGEANTAAISAENAAIDARNAYDNAGIVINEAETEINQVYAKYE